MIVDLTNKEIKVLKVMTMIMMNQCDNDAQRAGCSIIIRKLKEAEREDKMVVTQDDMDKLAMEIELMKKGIL